MAANKWVNVSNALHIGHASGFEVRGNTILHVAEGASRPTDPAHNYGGEPAPCGQASPNNYAMRLNTSSDGSLTDNVFVTGCHGYCAHSTQRLLLEGNTFQAVGLVGLEGSGFSSQSTGAFNRFTAFLRNRDVGVNAAFVNGSVHRMADESFTSDGSYGGYFGLAAASATHLSNRSQHILALQGEIQPNQCAGEHQGPFEPGFSNDCGWAGGALYVVQGTGAGQLRTVVAARTGSRFVEVDRPFSTALDQTSLVTLCTYIGDAVVAGNHFSNGTAVQYYGSAFHAVIADNVLANMTGSQTVGGGIHFNSMRYGNGVQPNFAIEVRGNLLSYSDGIAISGGFNQSTWPGNSAPERTLTHGFIVRNNILRNVHIEKVGCGAQGCTGPQGRNWGNGIAISNAHGGVVEANRVQVPGSWVRQQWLPANGIAIDQYSNASMVLVRGNPPMASAFAFAAPL